MVIFRLVRFLILVVCLFGGCQVQANNSEIRNDEERIRLSSNGKKYYSIEPATHPDESVNDTKRFNHQRLLHQYNEDKPLGMVMDKLLWEKYDWVRIIIAPSFSQGVLYSVVSDSFVEPYSYVYAKSFDEGISPQENLSRKASLGDGLFVPEPYNTIVEAKVTRRGYATRLDTSIVKNTLQGIASEDLAQLNYSASADHLCLDGTWYFIDGHINGDFFFVTRNNCDPDFAAIFSILSPVTSLAIKSLPDVQALICEHEQMILNNTVKIELPECETAKKDHDPDAFP